MRFLFCASGSTGHVNPTLPIVRALVDLGHEVLYVSFEEMRGKVEAAGAEFFSFVDIEPECYHGQAPHDPEGAYGVVLKELGLDHSTFLSVFKVLNVVLETQLPGAVRFLLERKPDVVVHDSLPLCRDVPLAAQALGIPRIGVLSLAGPGAWLSHRPATMAPLTLAQASEEVRKFQQHAEATERINAAYGLQLAAGLPQPAGKLDSLQGSTIVVTTSEDLQDPLPGKLAEAYQKDGTSFVFAGPLLAAPAAKTAAGQQEPVVQKVAAARAAGRPVVLVSMGTLLTSQDKLFGWTGRSGCPSGARSLSGQELCRAAWAGAFDAFGVKEEVDDDVVGAGAPLLVVSLGGHLELLSGVNIPKSAFCEAFVPQVDLLRVGIDLFVTHGGQNSFTEAMAHKTPLVVVPGFGDQHANARKAVKLGVGLKVDRPECPAGDEAAVAAKYRQTVCETLREGLAKAGTLRAAASRVGDGLQSAGGVPLAVETILAAGAGSRQGGAVRSTTESQEGN